MPYVSDEFVKKAVALAHHTQDACKEAGEQEKKSQAAKAEKKAAEDRLMAQAEMVADVLVDRGVVEAENKEASIQGLLDHEQTLKALSKTAQLVGAPSLGRVEEQEKKANSGMDEANRLFVERLGLL